MALKVWTKWYRAGLNFECQQCGNCCGGFPGYVWVSAEEMQNIADYLNITVDEFKSEYTVKVGRKYSLIEHGNYDCIFLQRDNNGGHCLIYPVRPTQCRTWPFWKSNLTNPDTWNEQIKRCPGINRGPKHTFEEIEERRKKSPC